MSNALAIAGVTAVLRDLLNDGLINHNVAGVVGSTVSVSVGPPDRVLSNGDSETSQLNLFLYQVTPNSGWRNEALPSRDGSGRNRLTNPPLALDLHYLLSAYSGADLHGEILLGYGAQLLHETPVLSRAAIRTALTPSPDVGTTLPPALRALADCGLAEQVEQIKITPNQLDGEQMSQLWSATQSSYRPSAAYRASVVLIEAVEPSVAALPVLSRGPVDPLSGRDRGVAVQSGLVPALPTLESVQPAGSQTVVQLGQSVTLSGHHLAGSGREVVLRNDRFGIDETIAANAGSADDAIVFTIPPAAAADVPVGIYEVFARLTRPGESDPRVTNSLSLLIAPEISGLPISIPADGAGTASFSLAFTPSLRAGQSVDLLLGQAAVQPEAFTAPVASLDFVIDEAPLGDHLARLRIDGIESPIIDRSATPPVFLNRRIEIT
ncbi:MAG: DUF4255 domain-containing protein [Kiloniellales bacterium]